MIPIKRLKSFILGLAPNDNLYRSIYEGEMLLYPPPEYEEMDPQTVYESTYWYNDSFGFTYDRTNKLVLDLPTVIVKIPADLLGITKPSEVAADYCLRAFIPFINELNAGIFNRSRLEKENGRYHIFEPDGKIVSRNASYFTVETGKYYMNRSGVSAVEISLAEQKPPMLFLNIMIQVQLPYKKHSKTLTMLTKTLPMAVEDYAEQFDRAGLQRALELEVKENAIREWLRQSDYCAFVANGSILPRSKNTDLPLENALLFQSPPEDEMEVCGLRGMGIRRGVTVITGGGYSGKSTLLDAIADGIYNHIEGDGREFVITDETAMQIASEDGRSVRNIDISPFIKWIPSGDPTHFSTDRASGSTSQASNIMEAVGYGCRLFLIDEDRSATNFMIRDSRMKRLIKREPITPYTERAQELFHTAGVSTVLVIGGSGEYLGVADNIIMMNDFAAENATSEAHRIIEQDKSIGVSEAVYTGDRKCLSESFNSFAVGAEMHNYDQAQALISPDAVMYFHDKIQSDNFKSYPEGSGTEKLLITDTGFLYIGNEKIDTRALYDLTSISQLNAIGYILRDIMIRLDREQIPVLNLNSLLADELERLKTDGLDSVYTAFFPDNCRWFELPRKNELLAVINRMKLVEFL